MMTLLYAAIQFCFWFWYGSIVNFITPYLLSYGLSNTFVGTVSAVACAISVIFQPIFAALADRPGKVSAKHIAITCCAVTLLLSLCLICTEGMDACFMGCAFLCSQIALPFVNALASESIQQGKHVNFSLSRGLGSIGYAFMAFLIGRLIAIYHESILPYCILVMSLLLGCLILLFPFEKRNAQTVPSSHGRPGQFVHTYQRFIVTLLGCVLIYTGHILINNFLFQIVVSKGGNSAHMGNCMSLAGVLEILAMFGFSFLRKWKSPRFWFRISGIFFTLKALCTLLAPSIPVLYIVQVFQPLGWGLLTVSSVYYVQEIMHTEDQVKGQAYMTMSLSLATVIGSILGGWLLDTIGVAGMLIVATILSFIGTVLVLCFAPRPRVMDNHTHLL